MAAPFPLLILIPHRDCGGPLRDYRAVLFRAGFPGAYSFPGAVPLGLCSRPLLRRDLKELVRELRERSRGGDGKFRTLKTPETLELLPGVRMAGLPLLIEGDTGVLSPAGLDFFRGEGRPEPYPRFLLSAGLTAPDFPLSALPPPPELSFRAAQAAVCRFFSLPSGDPAYSVRWETGEGVWLPPPRGSQKAPAVKNPMPLSPPEGYAG